MNPRRRQPCDYPQLPHGVHNWLFVCGWRCTQHTPRALRGLPEIPPGPGWPPGALIHQKPDRTTEEQHNDDSPRQPAEPR